MAAQSLGTALSSDGSPGQEHMQELFRRTLGRLFFLNSVPLVFPLDDNRT